MRHYRDVALDLRLRGVREPEIAVVLERIAKGSDTDPTSLAGDPSASGEQCGAPRRRSTGQRFAGAMTVLGVVIAATGLVVAKVVGLPVSVGVVPVPLTAAAGCVAVGIVCGFLLDRRLPRGFDRSRSRRATDVR